MLGIFDRLSIGKCRPMVAVLYPSNPFILAGRSILQGKSIGIFQRKILSKIEKMKKRLSLIIVSIFRL